MNLRHKDKCDFALFLIIWNQRQGMKTPRLHLKMANWLEQRWRAGDRRLLLMAFRSAGKSTIAGIFSAWLLFCNPALRIIVLSADSVLAAKMVRNVKRIIERHPLTKSLKPQKPDQWAKERFTVNRDIELRDPSMLARGIGSNITGSRADIVICDDVEVPATCDNMDKRADLRERLAEISYVLAAGGTQLYIGTPHSYFSIYADEPRLEIGEDQPFLAGFSRLKLPILDSNGQSLWPERYSKRDIERLKATTGPNKFASQMMLQPVNIAEGRLDPSLLRIYDHHADFVRELGSLYIGEKKMVSVSAWWDPAFAGAGTGAGVGAGAGIKRGGRGDNSVLAVVYADNEGNYYIHHIEYISIDNLDSSDEATQQCRIIASLAKRFYLPSVTVEINGIGRFLPNILRREMALAKAPCSVLEASSKRAKDLRIIEAFDALLASGRLYLHKNILQTPFMMEMREWRPAGYRGGSSGRASQKGGKPGAPSSLRGHDDGLDAVAGALSLQPDRLERLYKKGGQSWVCGQKIHKADSDFKV